ncbi:MAG TPA: histidine--tRNA ligase [Pirellulaceae bacterium]|nr:histidine--tRNA ligase [Pirellulaceae bacterium]
MSEIIKPRTLSGFRDFLPDAMIMREWLIDTTKQVYRSYGYAPIDTPALEYFEILAGKGSEETDRQMYQFRDQGDRHVGMRFDLTVPLARYCAQHINELGTPFKRYHIATVWRGEKAQTGRYREFMQCDFDTIGTTSIQSDIETGLVIYDLMRAIGFDRFKIRVNNRKVLNGFLDKHGLASASVAVLRAIDKFEKVGKESVAAEIQKNCGATESQIEQVFALVEKQPDNLSTLERLKSLISGNELGEQGVAELEHLILAMEAVGIREQSLAIDVSIARGLDYYTGTIFETNLLDLPSIGSVCSGGRYDNLAELFTRQKLPGIGASLGLDRLLAAMETLGMTRSNRTQALVLIAMFDERYLHDYLRLAAGLRAAGIGTEVYPEPKKVGVQLKYADKKGYRFAIIAGEDEFNRNIVQIKHLPTSEQCEVPFEQNVDSILGQLRVWQE